MNSPFALTPDGPSAINLVAYAVLAFGLTVILTRPLIGWLAARQLGKAIRVDGPDHAAKAGTPTMGGLGMLAAIAIVGGVWVWQAQGAGWTRAAWHVALPLVAMIAFGALGLVDDLQGLARKGRAREIGVGLTARQMIAAQVIAATAVFSLAWHAMFGDLPTDFGTPAFALALALALIGVVGTVNGVNLSDGLDGLAAGLLVLAFGWVASFGGLKLAAFASADLDIGPETDVVGLAAIDGSWVTLAAIAAAACLAFLVFNRHPARVFMGNVASMGLGGLLATLCLVSGAWLWLPLFGIVFVAEVVSDIVQIGYFKWTGGKRFFRMAPLHHHFEKGGMPETQVVRRFWAAGLAGGIAAVVAMRWVLG